MNFIPILNSLLFILVMNTLQRASKSEVTSTNLSMQKNIDKTNKTRNISLLLEKIQTFMQIMPIELEETGNETCDEHLQLLVGSLRNMEPWAWQMIDASSKIPEGLFDGHLMNLGNFYECISVSVPDNIFKGKYCLSLLSFGLNASVYEYLKYMNWHAFPSQYIAGDHVLIFGPQLAVCLPSTCSADNLQTAVNKYLKRKNISAVYFSRDDMCSIDEYESFDTNDWIVIGIICCFALMAVLSTYYDMMTNHLENRRDIFISFSLYTNGKKLLSSKCDTYLNSVHGVRSITAIWILLVHVHLFVVEGSANVVQGALQMERLDRLIITNSVPAVDTFLLMSGLLICHSFLNDMKNKNLRDFNILLFYFSRYLRLTPVVAVMLMLSITIERHFGSGPLWGGIDVAAENCRQNWWIPLLYIQNYMERSQCILETWYLAVDFQLFMFSPILLIVIWKKPRLGIAVLILLAIVGFGIIFAITFIHEERLPIVQIGHDVSAVKTMKNSQAELVYQRNRLFMKTHARFSPWVIGFLLGYILHKCKGKSIVFQKLYIVMGWILSPILILSSVIYGHHILQSDYEYNVWECSIYFGLHHITWSIGVGWVIFACATGYGGTVNWLLSLSAWLPLSRLVYTIYIFQCLVLQILILTELDNRNVTYTDTITTLVMMFAVTVVVSAVVSLIFESPLIAILKIMFRGSSRKRVEPPLSGNEEITVDSR